MGKYFKLAEKKLNFVEKVDSKEWDFSPVPREEQRACCYFEWARESDHVIKALKTARKQKLRYKKQLKDSPIIYGFSGRSIRRELKEPWLAKSDKWRADFCQHLTLCWDKLKLAPSQAKRKGSGFQVGMSPFYDSKLWTGKKKQQAFRHLDKKKELETLLVTINWGDFGDKEIIKAFTEWLKGAEGRPLGVGRRDKQGQNKQRTWETKLERLAVLRLLRHYTKAELDFFALPNGWKYKSRFSDPSEMGRELELARQTLRELYPFLPPDALPRSFYKALENLSSEKKQS